jgi:thiamine biosynthesis lipoprotein ApbE
MVIITDGAVVVAIIMVGGTITTIGKTHRQQPAHRIALQPARPNLSQPVADAR